MSSVLDVEVGRGAGLWLPASWDSDDEFRRLDIGLPPGLVLPTAEDPIDQFRVESFNHDDHQYSELKEFGAFATAMTTFVADGKRPSFMPSARIIREMYFAGYGIGFTRLNNAYGGLRKLQNTLGFYSGGAEPERAEIIERCQWLADRVVPKVAELNPVPNRVGDLLAWASIRNLLPSPEIVRSVLNGNTLDIQKIFGIEKHARWYGLPATRREVFRFGARVIEENGGPLAMDALNERYPSVFTGTPEHTIKAHFGSKTSAFWESFGYYNFAYIDAEGLLEAGVRLAIVGGGFDFSTHDLNRLSRQKRFPSSNTLRAHYGGSYPAYKAAVQEEYELFVMKAKELSAAGVSDEVIQIVGARYSTGEAYMQGLDRNIVVLSKISLNSYSAKLVRDFLKDGFDLKDDKRWELQVKALRGHLNALGIKSRDEISYIFGLIPRT